MKNPFIVKPTGLKGNDKLNRMRELMGQSQLNEDVKNSVVELTKLGPDGKVYGVVREGHNYFIKITDKQSKIWNLNCVVSKSELASTYMGEEDQLKSG